MDRSNQFEDLGTFWDENPVCYGLDTSSNGTDNNHTDPGPNDNSEPDVNLKLLLILVVPFTLVPLCIFTALNACTAKDGATVRVVPIVVICLCAIVLCVSLGLWPGPSDEVRAVFFAVAISLFVLLLAFLAWNYCGCCSCCARCRRGCCKVCKSPFKSKVK